MKEEAEFNVIRLIRIWMYLTPSPWTHVCCSKMQGLSAHVYLMLLVYRRLSNM
jgi:hypothetical protein